MLKKFSYLGTFIGVNGYIFNSIFNKKTKNIKLNNEVSSFYKALNSIPTYRLSNAIEMEMIKARYLSDREKILKKNNPFFTHLSHAEKEKLRTCYDDSFAKKNLFFEKEESYENRKIIINNKIINPPLMINLNRKKQ